MPYRKHALEYRKNAVNGATPVGLVVLLYDGAIRFMEGGKQAVINRDLQKQDEQLQKAQKIVLELMTALDMYRGGKLAQNLLALYTFVIEQLVMANMKDETEPIDRALQIMTELRKSWVAVNEETRVDVHTLGEPVAA